MLYIQTSNNMLIAKCIQDFDPWNEEKYPINIGKTYEVNDVDMGRSYTTIYLVGFKQGFNSVCFKFYENNRSINIYKDRRYNPYL